MRLQCRDHFHVPNNGRMLEPGNLLTPDEEALVRGADNAPELLAKCTQLSDEAAANIEPLVPVNVTATVKVSTRSAAPVETPPSNAPTP